MFETGIFRSLLYDANTYFYVHIVNMQRTQMFIDILFPKMGRSMVLFCIVNCMGVILLDNYQKTLTLWQYYALETPVDLNRYLDSFRIIFAYNSSKIENSSITYHNT